MGMDVVGRNNPDAYFRNNVWWWHPLWEYCCSLYPECHSVSGHSNDSDGLDADHAAELADKIRFALATGDTEEYELERNMHLASLPLLDCKYCEATGIRTDVVGRDNGMDTRLLDPELQIILGRTHGWCNACRGEGAVEDPATHYSFSVDNVREFLEFLDDSGGFMIC